MTVGEKEKVLLGLKENTPEVKKELFNKILIEKEKEKEKEISLIGNYKKEEWKKENESIRSFENKARIYVNYWIVFRRIKGGKMEKKNILL